ncbi:MAG: HAMP domain-containing protein [Sandaracinaceae bacterium]|nr:HAMP domain-containing protein [Sandaracinaceae bacterium]
MPKLSIPTRIFLGFAFVLVAFGVVASASIRQHQRTASTLRLLHDGYLPLALDVAEVRANQAVFGTLVDRILEEEDTSATRSWLNSARRARPAILHRALIGIDRVEAMAPPERERALLSSLRQRLVQVRAAYVTDDAHFDDLTRALVARDRPRAERVLAQLRSRERDIERNLRRATDSVQDGLAAMSAAAEDVETRSVQLFAAIAFIALGVGLAITWWARRVLAPLSRLQERVAAVGRGDSTERLHALRDDEIGRLTLEFERMVEAITARDARLLQSERLAAIGRMAAHVTHEVRNPLSSIGLNVEMLEEETASSGPEVKALLRAIHREVDRLTGVTEEYLRLARLPAPRFTSEDLSELVRDVTSFVRAEMESADIHLEVQGDESALVSLDEGQVRQALLNLLRNAREAMPKGGKIVVRVARHEDAHLPVVRLIVEDEGEGMSEDVRAHIFDPFFTTKQGGTGLGLPLTQQVMLAHGGSIACEAASPRGTRFTLIFLEQPPAPSADDANKGTA